MHDMAVKLNPQIMMAQPYGGNQSPKWYSFDEMVSTGLKFAELSPNVSTDMEPKTKLGEQELKQMPLSEEVVGTDQDLLAQEKILDNYIVGQASDEVICLLEENLQSINGLGEEVMATKMKLLEFTQSDLDLVKQVHCLKGHIKATNMPLGPEKSKLPITRQSSRVQDKEVPVQDKAVARKAGNKGIISCSIPSTSSSDCSLDTIARVCGFSLGLDESIRLANISLIQAKEDALLALERTKHKLMSSSDSVRDKVSDESSVDHQSPALEFAEASATFEDNLPIRDQG
jgi:hypothetical protein